MITLAGSSTNLAYLVSAAQTRKAGFSQTSLSLLLVLERGGQRCITLVVLGSMGYGHQPCQGMQPSPWGLWCRWLARLAGLSDLRYLPSGGSGAIG